MRTATGRCHVNTEADLSILVRDVVFNRELIDYFIYSDVQLSCGRNVLF